MTRRMRYPRSRQLVPVAAVAVGIVALAALAGCQTTPPAPPLALAPRVELPRVMGDWYVIANLPTFLEKGAHNAREQYKLDADGTVATTFSFNADAFDGPQRSYRSRGFVLKDVDAGNAVWGQQYVWPIKADYRIAYVSADYGVTIIARAKRDHVWIMARTPTLPDAEYRRLAERVAALGYDASQLQKVPQQPR